MLPKVAARHIIGAYNNNGYIYQPMILPPMKPPGFYPVPVYAKRKVQRTSTIPPSTTLRPTNPTGRHTKTPPTTTTEPTTPSTNPTEPTFTRPTEITRLLSESQAHSQANSNNKYPSYPYWIYPVPVYAMRTVHISEKSTQPTPTASTTQQTTQTTAEFHGFSSRSQTTPIPHGFKENVNSENEPKSKSQLAKNDLFSFMCSFYSRACQQSNEASVRNLLKSAANT